VTVRFEQLTFDWQEYANYRPHATTYLPGELTFLPQEAHQNARL
jgi:hypothetical protein